MTVEQNATRVDADRLAAAARSILACPAEVQLVVDGVDDITAGIDDADRAVLTMEDAEGRPVFACPTGSALAMAGMEGRSALLTVASGLGRPGAASRTASLTLSGRLETTGQETCGCCEEVQAVVTLHVNFVLLSRDDAPGSQFRVPLPAFDSPAHTLNRGYLQRSVEHTNSSHQDELRRAVATMSDTRLADVIGVALRDLDPAGVDLEWVDTNGAHRRRIDFPERAASPYELGEMLRDGLHAGLC
ncbi:hypothetical protein [Nocardioides sambongensis]|uniref:hypothetical protein n=1 Tax=Nocardioides sambongensis TaxID=2589074 RepID=UPI001127B358|nr:hypothetical protein [Nocardioides sambongensis]